MNDTGSSPKKTEKKKASRFGRVKLIILLGVLVYSGITFANQQSMLAVQVQKQAELENQQETLQREIDFLRNELNYIGTDEYVEQQARIRLGWLKPDEVKYVEGQGAADPDNEETTGTNDEVAPQPEPSPTE